MLQPNYPLPPSPHITSISHFPLSLFLFFSSLFFPFNSTHASPMLLRLLPYCSSPSFCCRRAARRFPVRCCSSVEGGPSSSPSPVVCCLKPSPTPPLHYHLPSPSFAALVQPSSSTFAASVPVTSQPTRDLHPLSRTPLTTTPLRLAQRLVTSLRPSFIASPHARTPPCNPTPSSTILIVIAPSLSQPPASSSSSSSSIEPHAHRPAKLLHSCIAQHLRPSLLLLPLLRLVHLLLQSQLASSATTLSSSRSLGRRPLAPSCSSSSLTTTTFV